MPLKKKIREEVSQSHRILFQPSPFTLPFYQMSDWTLHPKNFIRSIKKYFYRPPRLYLLASNSLNWRRSSIKLEGPMTKWNKRTAPSWARHRLEQQYLIQQIFLFYRLEPVTQEKRNLPSFSLGETACPKEWKEPKFQCVRFPGTGKRLTEFRVYLCSIYVPFINRWARIYFTSSLFNCYRISGDTSVVKPLVIHTCTRRKVKRASPQRRIIYIPSNLINPRLSRTG